MKKSCFALLCVMILALASKAQEGKNLLKLNLLPLLAGNVSLEYERSLADKISINGTISYRSKTSLPFKSTIESIIDDESSLLSTTKLGAFSVAPEVRFYLGKKDVLKGFYIAPFVKYSSYGITTEVEFESNGYSAILPVEGTMTGFTGGVSLGSQWSLAKNVFLDWRIIGPNYGVSSGNLVGKRTLNEMEQAEIRNQLEDLDLVIFNTETTVDANGANVKTSGAFAGIRTALSIGYRF